jgi:hypothetical protein
MAITPDAVRRLAFAKYLYSTGEEQARRPPPMNAAALLLFHDAIELFLQIGSEHLDAGKGQLALMDYFDLLSSKTVDPVSQKESVRRLSRARAALKHNGILPSTQDLHSFRETTARFFEENTLRIFGVEFGAVSLIDFVASKGARAQLQKAAVSKSDGKMEDGLAAIAIAFDALLHEYEKPKSKWGVSPFSFGPDFGFPAMAFTGKPADPVTFKYVELLAQAVGALQVVCKLLSLGIDYRRYSRFRLHMPSVMRMMDESYTVTFPYPLTTITNGEDFDFCFNFVIETALALSEFDFELPRYTPEGSWVP